MAVLKYCRGVRQPLRHAETVTPNDGKLGLTCLINHGCADAETVTPQILVVPGSRYPQKPVDSPTYPAETVTPLYAETVTPLR